MDTQNPHSTVESDDLIKELKEPLIMTNLNNHSTSNTSEEPELSMEELDAKWDALENDPEFLAKPIWQQIIEIGALVPQSEWRKHFPRDFARNFEHYMYGAPREDEEE
jgi:hypothetical protein